MVRRLDKARRLAAWTLTIGLLHAAAVPPIGAVTTGATTAAPTADSGSTPTAPILTTPRPDYANIQVLGRFRPIATGNTNGIRWSLLRAPGAYESTCFRLDTRPSARSAQTNSPSGARCIPPSALPDEPADAVIASISPPRSRIQKLAMYLPRGSSRASIGFAGGRIERLPVREQTFVVWTGREIPLWLGFRAQGATVDCAAGAILGRSDLRDNRLIAISKGAPWACLDS